MSEEAKEKIDLMVKESLEKQLAQRDAKEKEKNSYEKLAEKIDDSLKGRADKKGDDHGHDLHAQHEHVHATHSSNEYCPSCQEKNPDYDADQVTCKDCGGDVGTVKEIEEGKVTTCRHCGSKEGEHKSKGYSL